MPAFTSGVEYYELFANAEARLHREGPLLLDTVAQSPGWHAADIACGTGLHAHFLASNDVTVDAFDYSAEMIGYARAHRAHSGITWHTGDMRDLNGGPWDTVFCLGNSLSLLPNPDDLKKTFRAVYSSLSTGGLFFSQILNYRKPAFSEPRQRIERKKANGADILAVKNLVPHGNKTILTLSYVTLSGESSGFTAEHAVLTNWTSDDLLAASAAAGFSVHAVYGGYDKSAYDPEKSGDVVMVLRKG